MKKNICGKTLHMLNMNNAALHSEPCCPSGSKWEIPDSNEEPSPQQFGILTTKSPNLNRGNLFLINPTVTFNRQHTVVQYMEIL